MPSFPTFDSAAAASEYRMPTAEQLGRCNRIYAATAKAQQALNAAVKEHGSQAPACWQASAKTIAELRADIASILPNPHPAATRAANALCLVRVYHNRGIGARAGVLSSPEDWFRRRDDALAALEMEALLAVMA